MKTSFDPRHQRRIRLIQALYALQFDKAVPLELSVEDQKELDNIQRHSTAINELIDQYATKFASGKMARIDLAILQLGIYELVFSPHQEPYKVIADECIELAKEFGAVNSPKFINGIIGSIIEHSLSEHEKSSRT